MKTSRIPYDLTLEFRAYQAARRRNRIVAGTGAVLLLLMTVICNGVMMGTGSLWRCLGGVVITIWGSLGIHYFLTRH